MPYARAITNGTIINYDGRSAVRNGPVVYREPPAPPWTAATMPRDQELVVRPSSTFVIEGHHSWQDFPKAPGPSDWRPSP